MIRNNKYIARKYTTEAQREENEAEEQTVEKILEEEDKPSAIEIDYSSHDQPDQPAIRHKKHYVLSPLCKKFLYNLKFYQYEQNEELFELFLANKFTNSNLNEEGRTFCIAIGKALASKNATKALRIFKLLRSQHVIPVAVFEMFLFFDCMHAEISNFTCAQIIQEMLRVGCSPSKTFLEIMIMGYARTADSWLIAEWADLYFQQLDISSTVVSFLIERLISRGAIDHAWGYYLQYEQLSPLSRISPDLKLQLLLKLGREEEAISLFDAMRSSRTVSSSNYLTFFKYYLESDDYKRASALMLQMLQSNLFPSSPMYHQIMLKYYDQMEGESAWKLYQFLRSKSHLPYDSIIILSLTLIRAGLGERIEAVINDCADRINFPPKFFKVAIRELINQNKIDALISILKRFETLFNDFESVPKDLAKLTFNAAILTGSYRYATIMLEKHPELTAVLPLYYYVQPPVNEPIVAAKKFDRQAEAAFYNLQSK